ncbi:MAG: cell division protein FtsB [Gammaproteobacteria bacterium]|nr:cell division protein FtsB [Gammaproteobacteria bacterium]
MRGRLILAVLAMLLALSQYQLWVGTGSLAEVQRLRDELGRQALENERLASRNAELAKEVHAIKTDPQAIEELLRSRFGYVRDGETFIRLIPKADQTHD